jgi:anthranilate phosphoribosyltransferase
MDIARKLIEKTERLAALTPAEAEMLMEELLSERMQTPDIVRLLLALNERPIQAGELAAFARIIRRHAAPVFAPGVVPPTNLVDTCGTGGDDSGTFNISTPAALVAAAAGARVAKHGNRSVSSKCGSADVLEALGVDIDIPLERAGQAICELGIGFLFAPAAHAAARHAVPARKQIGRRTVFNLLGPLTNPAHAENQVVGVFSGEVIDLVASALVELGVGRALVVHGAGGLDEISIAGETLVAEVRDASYRRLVVTPADFGLPAGPLEPLRGGSPQENAALIRRLFEGQPGPRRDIVLMNAAAALVVTGVATDFCQGKALAEKAISSGAAGEKLAQLQAFTNAHE